MDILMPQLGETVAEGTVTNWYKQVGDSVRADEALFDVETDKVSTEVPSPVSGVLAEVLVPAGQTVKVGTRLAVVRGANEQAAPAGGAAPSHAPAQAAAGVHAPASQVRSLRLEADVAARSEKRKLSPVVRRLLAQHGLSAAGIQGSGRDGRVMRDDVLAHIGRAGSTQPAAAAAASPSPAPLPAAPAVAQATTDSSMCGAGERVVPLNSIRRRSAAAMARAWQSVPHVLQAIEADYSRIESARRSKGPAWQAREGYELTYLPFLAWATCQALLRYEQLNARIDGDRLIVSRRVHLGIAVDLAHDGLVVPVIRDAQDRTLSALGREIRRLAVGARGNKLTPDDFSQPSYTISNSGVFGTLITAPIVNPPQVAILSTDGVAKRAVVVASDDGDSLAIRPVGVLAQSFDHRAVDGAYSAAFLKELKRLIETRAWSDDLP
ncbi:MAG: 2-oxo acid dehydrogenase subunit E2 [Burkholderiales bacterium]|nr:2-oxo acid dehydrogenase subunit E2 [Burkholderiales bacterium]